MVRALLETEFGVDCTTITWITQNPPHVADAPEPANVVRDPNGKVRLNNYQMVWLAAILAMICPQNHG